MSESPRLTDARLVQPAPMRRRPVSYWVEVPSNISAPPSSREWPARPRVVFAEIKPRLTEADLRARYQTEAADAEPVRPSRTPAIQEQGVPRGCCSAAFWKRVVQGLGLVLALTAVAAGTPVI